MKQLQAIRALRWNYRWRGVWAWLKGRQRCRNCHGEGRIPGGISGGIIGLSSSPASFTARVCPCCDGGTKVRGYRRILSEPETVITEQTRLADGVYI